MNPYPIFDVFEPGDEGLMQLLYLDIFLLLYFVYSIEDVLEGNCNYSFLDEQGDYIVFCLAC
jgi:hypothetical protein